MSADGQTAKLIGAVCAGAVGGVALGLCIAGRRSKADKQVSAQKSLYDVPVCMDGAEFRAAGKDMVDFIVDHRQTLRERKLPVRSDAEPWALSQKLPSKAPEQGEPWADIVADVENLILPAVTNWEHPEFFAFFKPHASLPSILGELLCAGLNNMCFSWDASPAATELELRVLDWVAHMMKLPEHFFNSHKGPGGGLIQGSAGESLIVALRAAVQRLTPDESVRAVAYCSDQTHSIMQKACTVLRVECCVLPTTAASGFTLDPEVLQKRIVEDRKNKKIPVFVCATYGSTTSCVIDPVAEIGALCAKEKLWLHLDAAYGGAYAVLDEFRQLMNGVELCDSLAINAHKKMLVGFDCCMFWYKDDTQLREAMAITPEYLKNTNNSLDLKDLQLPLGRRFRALKLWFTLRSFGREGMMMHIRRGVELAKRFEQHVVKSTFMEMVQPVHFALAVFRLKGRDDAAQMDLLQRVNKSNEAYLIHSKLGDQLVLRLACGGVEQCMEDVDVAWNVISREAAAAGWA